MIKKYYRSLLLVVAVAAIAAIIVFVMHLTSDSDSAKKQEPSSSATEGTAAAASGTTTVPLAAALESHFHEETTAPVVVKLPETSGETAAFNAAYKPDTRAEDVQTGAAVHLREVFGTGYADAAFVFSDDGSFTDTLSGKSGRYQVKDGAITAITFPDQRLEINVTEWKDDGKTPLRFSVIYRTVGEKGYKVTYAEE